ncbi:MULTISPECIES: hypothetical protein [Haladaptatus]|uniref:DUF8119 domain-containing protein n=2 Tax=Haladaptatus paucihalophilus DX253 TaxID=797209 RepID=A0A1M6ZZZ8_HALPU|nr:hypothetical protein [Haladaptatus paucihalophilus]SHL35976.1 hypothetical protein SAMN05444342_3641 [Haladaptatus paucihalophilus DX253]
MSLTGTVLDHVREHRSGMVVDLAFAVIWVAVVSALFDALPAPTWAYHLSLFAGVVAYFGFFASLESARDAQ